MARHKKTVQAVAVATTSHDRDGLPEVVQQSTQPPVNSHLKHEYTSEYVYKLAGVKQGEFPFALTLINKTQSALAFPVLGEQEANFLQQNQPVKVIFKNALMLDDFVRQLADFAELFDWDENHGVFILKKD